MSFVAKAGDDSYFGKLLQKLPELDKSVKIHIGEDKVFRYDATSKQICRDDGPADITIRFALEEDFKAMMENRLDPIAAVLGGKMQVSGDLTTAMQIQTAFGRYLHNGS